MAKKDKCEECPQLAGWITSFSDLMSLLLVFFIVMFAMANTDLKNFAQVAEALRAAFSNPLAIVPSTVGLIGETSGPKNVTNPVAAPVFFDRLPPRHKDFIRVSTELAVMAEELGVGGKVSVNSTIEGIVISLSDSFVFEPGSSDLKPEATEMLNQIAALLSLNNNAVRIEGNTDNIPSNNPLYPTNWELSTARAVAIVRYLSEQADIESERLTAAGNGEFNPLVPNDSRDNRSINRRADIIIIYPSESRDFSVDLPDTPSLLEDAPSGDETVPAEPVEGEVEPAG